MVSAVGVGCNNFGGRLDAPGSRRVVHKALDLGINLFDTADMYGEFGDSERYLGESLGPRRKEVVLATKFGWQMDRAGRRQGASRGYIMSAVEASLRRLGTEWIDLYQLHRPDPATPIEETLRALDDLIAQGKVRFIGCSNLPASQVADAVAKAGQLGVHGFVCCQDQYSLVTRAVERDLLPVLSRHGLGLLPYAPLASGLLSGKYLRGRPLPPDSRLGYTEHLAQRFLTDRCWTLVERLSAFCERRGRVMLELAFSWLVRQPQVASVIAGAMTPQQVEQNVAAIGWALTDDDVAELDSLTAM
jgi:aryl-alcohol dehydrogenase-like predicted oxidoreductase